MAVDQTLRDALSAMSILIVFITVLFGVRYQAIVDLLNRTTPRGDMDRSDLCRDLKASIMLNCLPQCIIGFLVVGLFLAPLRGLLSHGVCSLSILERSFMLIYGLIVVFWLWAVVLLVQHVVRIRQHNTKQSNRL